MSRPEDTLSGKILTRPRRPDDPPGEGRVVSRPRQALAVLSLLGLGAGSGNVDRVWEMASYAAGMPPKATVESELRKQHVEDLAELESRAESIQRCWAHWQEHVREAHGL